MQTIDIGKQFKELYTAKKKIEEISAERGTYLALEGQGEPGGEAYRSAIEKLYTVAYTLKFSLKGQGVVDFKVPKLECLWLFDDPKSVPRAEWPWRLQSRIPDEVTAQQIKQTVKAIRDKKDLDCSAVKRRSWKEGRALQLLHVGPYEKLGESYGKLHAEALQLGYRERGPAHEVYLSDPRRVEPERLKTIVRMPISRPRR